MSDECKNILNRIDQYALPIQLKYKTKIHFTSWIGGLFSILIYILFIALSIYLFVDMTDKDNQNIVKFPRRDKHPKRLNLTMDNEYNMLYSKKEKPEFYKKNDTFVKQKDFFFWAFAFENKSSLSEIPFSVMDTMFSVDLRLIQRNASTGLFSNLKVYEFKRCGDMFKEFPFEKKILPEAMCLNDTKFEVEGDFISPIYTFVNIKFQICKNNLNPSVAPIKTNCASEAVIKSLMNDILVTFIGTDYFIDPQIKEYQSFTNYVPYKIKVQLSNQIYQKYDIYISEDKLVSQENLFIPSIDKYEGGVTSVKVVNPLFSNLSSSLMAFYIRSNYNYDIYHRSYKSFVEVVAQIGGIWKVLFLIGAVLMIPLNSKLLMVSLGNKMFNLIQPGEETMKEILEDNYKKYSENISVKEIPKIIKLSNKTKLEAEMAIDYYRFERMRGLDYSAKEAFASIFFMCCKPKAIQEKEEILEEAKKKLYKKLNTNNIFKFSVQISVIKKILLGKIKDLITYSTSSAIHTDKIDAIKELMAKYKEQETLDGKETSLYKEVDLIDGLRALHAKPMLDERVDINLLQQFKFRETDIQNYFVNHYTNIKKYLDKITVVVPHKKPSHPEDKTIAYDFEGGRRRELLQKEILELEKKAKTQEKVFRASLKEKHDHV